MYTGASVKGLKTKRSNLLWVLVGHLNTVITQGKSLGPEGAINCEKVLKKHMREANGRYSYLSKICRFTPVHLVRTRLLAQHKHSAVRQIRAYLEPLARNNGYTKVVYPDRQWTYDARLICFPIETPIYSRTWDIRITWKCWHLQRSPTNKSPFWVLAPHPGRLQTDRLLRQYRPDPVRNHWRYPGEGNT